MSTFAAGLNKANLPLLRDKINAALAGLDPALTCKAGNITFSEGSCTVKLEVQVQGMTSSAEKEAQRYAQMLGLDPSLRPDIPKVGPCRIVDIKTRATKMPWVVENEAGKRFKISSAMAEHYFKKVEK